jgi:predicted ATPase
MTLTRVKLEQFTAFESLDLALSPGINVFVGANGTGKTHLMKVCYAACDVSKTKASFAEKLVSVFLPARRAPGRLVRRQRVSARGSVEVFRGNSSLHASLSNHTKAARSVTIRGSSLWTASPIESVYIPVKEMLSHGPGFRSLYATREIHFDEVYADILDRAYLPLLRGPADSSRRRLLIDLQRVVDGKVAIENEEFFLRNRQGKLEFSLLAEGLRKLGLLWLLIQNGSLKNGSVLFWDEPETNLNPKLFGTVMNILLELQRGGVQVFLATHDYMILEELDLRKREDDEVAFHSLYRHDETGEVACNTSANYLGIHPNAIAEAFEDLYDREIERSLGHLRR